MTDNILESEYLELCSEFPLFEKMGHRGFGTKIWLVFRALNFGSVSLKSVASNPCQSLMENNITFSQIGDYLEELKRKGVFLENLDEYTLLPQNSYELHRICYQISNKIMKNGVPLDAIVRDCGYTWDKRNQTLVQNFTNGDVNAKTDTLKDLLSQLAFSGAKLLVKCVVKLTDKVE